MVNNNNMEVKRARAETLTELQVLDTEALTSLIVDAVDAKTLAVMTASLRVARKRGERESARLRSAALRKTS